LPSSGSWMEKKREAMKRLEEHLKLGLVDPDIVDMLIKLNRFPCIYTTSSCSGRVVVLEAENLMDKRGSNKLWVEHDPERCRNLCGVVERILEGRGLGEKLVWASLQPPVLHLYAWSEQVAINVVRCARESGFARACYRREDRWYFVEVSVHDKVHVVLPAPCSSLEKLCVILARYKERLRRFENCLPPRLCQGDDS